MPIDTASLLSARLRLPSHVVHRSFVVETVVLNLETGKYHGLNPIAGRMLDVLNEAPSVRDAALTIAQEYEEDQATVEADLLVFCRDLLDRKLMEIVDDSA